MKKTWVLSGLIIAPILVGKKVGMENIKIEPIQLSQVSTVKDIIVNCAVELKFLEGMSREELEEFCSQTNEFKDLEDPVEYYWQNNGVFYVLTDGKTVVGSGGLRRITHEVGELKRMFFKKEYRGRGLGTLLINKIIADAQQRGYKKLVLEVFSPTTSTAAVALYQRFGFVKTQPFNNGPAKLFMEKTL